MFDNDWESIRRELDFEHIFQYPAGSWFRVDDELIKRKGRKSKGTAFADKTGKRPVLLASRPGPNAVLYSRSTQSGGNGLPHRAHTHGDCSITKSGSIIYKVPVTVPSSALAKDSFSCYEPDEDLLAKLWKLAGP